MTQESEKRQGERETTEGSSVRPQRSESRSEAISTASEPTERFTFDDILDAGAYQMADGRRVRRETLVGAQAVVGNRRKYNTREQIDEAIREFESGVVYDPKAEGSA